MTRRSFLFVPALAAALAAVLAGAPCRAQTYNLQGFVKDSRGAGVGGVTLDLYDPVANARAAAAQNFTLANGQFNALFTPTNPAATTFYVDFAPAAGTGFAAVQLKDQRLTGTTVLLPDTILPDAVTLTVDVFDTSGVLPQASVDLDVIDVPTGSKIYTPGAVTSALGSVTVDVPRGVYDLVLTPPRAGPLGAASLHAQSVPAATTRRVNLPAGASVSGTVTDSRGAPLDRAPVTVSDPLTGRPVASRYNAAAGVVSFFLAPGVYDFVFEPPAGLDLMPVRRSAVAVPGPPLAIVLPDATVATGRVVDGGGVAQYGARFRVEDSVTGQAVDVYRARVDSTGAFRLDLPQGVFDITVLPPPGSSLLTRVLPHVAVGATPLDLGTIVLGAGFVVTGRVLGGGLPVVDVNVNVTEARTGASVATARDHTDAAGSFRIVLPAGAYDLDFLPPVATAWLDTVRRGVVVSGPLALAPDVNLAAGATVTATVVGRGAGPLEGASLHLIDTASGADLPLAHQSTCSLGTASFNAPPGRYLLEVLPPIGSTWLPLDGGTVTIAAPGTALGTLTLDSGDLVDGLVLEAAAPRAPVVDVNVNLLVPGTELQVLTARDHSDYRGHFVFAATPGTYDVELRPPLGTRYLARLLPGVSVPAGGVTLPDTLLDEGWLVSGRTIDSVTRAPVADVHVQLTDVPTGTVYRTPHDHSLFDGTFETVACTGTYSGLAIPAATSPYAVASFAPGSIFADRDLGDIPLAPGFFVGGTVRDAANAPLRDVTVTALQAGSGTEVPLARNVTDSAGVADGMVLPAGTYDLVFTPAPGSPYSSKLLAGLVVSADDHALFAVTLERPTLASVAPAWGPTRGGTAVTITGTGFSGGTPAVSFGGAPLAGVVLASPTTITGTTTAHAAGLVDVVVTLEGGATASRAAGFEFQSSSQVLLRVTRAGATDVRLDWAPAGAADYAVYRTRDAAALGAPVQLVAAPPVTLAGEIGSSGVTFYDVE